jgi:hypothetical protein
MQTLCSYPVVVWLFNGLSLGFVPQPNLRAVRRKRIKRALTPLICQYVSASKSPRIPFHSIGATLAYRWASYLSPTYELCGANALKGSDPFNAGATLAYRWASYLSPTCELILWGSVSLRPLIVILYL